MKKAILLLAIFCTATTFALTVPKKILGQYDADIPPFDFVEDGETVHASGYKVSILLRETYMWYRAGSMKLRGNYTEVNTEGGVFDIKVDVSNESSISFDLQLIVDKNAKTLILKGLKGLDAVECTKKEIVVEKKKTRFKSF